MTCSSEITGKMMDSDLVIGIDLGTTNSCASIYLNNRVTVLENKNGDRIISSCVFFTNPGGIVVGNFAKKMTLANPDYGVSEIKRIIGRKFDDPFIKKNIDYLPFKIKNIDNIPVVVIENKTQILIKKTPEEISAIILSNIKKDVQDKLGCNINKAVITVPAYFNVSQREATLAAAEKAGLTVVKLLNEPTAAALSYYNMRNDYSQDFYSLVYDLGGGTFDVAILYKQRGDIKIKGVDGDTDLGGHDFDNMLINYVSDILITKYSFDPRKDRRSLRRLAKECEDAKKMLSDMEECDIALIGFVPEHSSIQIKITRRKFEEMADSSFRRTIAIVKRCLDNANLLPNDIREVILSGGSTRIPKIQQMLSEFFNGRRLNRFVHPDECVSEGAALQAAMLSQSPEQQIDQVKIVDVVPLSLGISNFVNLMTFLIKRNSPLPASGSTNRVTIYSGQSNMSFEIYEGDRLNAKKNHYLGLLEISDLTPAPPGQCTVTVTMTLDQNAILSVRATEIVSRKTKDLKVTYTRGFRSDEEINNSIVDKCENEEEDRRFKKFAEEKAFLLKYCIRTRFNMEKLKLAKDFQHIYDKCFEIEQKMKQLTSDDIATVKAYKNEIMGKVGPISMQYKFEMMP